MPRCLNLHPIYLLSLILKKKKKHHSNIVINVLKDTLCSDCCTTRQFLLTEFLNGHFCALAERLIVCFFHCCLKNLPGSLLVATTIHHNLCAESNKSASNFGDYNSDDKNNTCYNHKADYYCSKNHSDQHDYSTLSCSTSSTECLDHCTIEGPDSAERSSEE